MPLLSSNAEGVVRTTTGAGAGKLFGEEVRGIDDGQSRGGRDVEAEQSTAAAGAAAVTHGPVPSRLVLP